MGEDCRSWFPGQHFDWQSSKLNSLSDPFGLGLPSATSAYMNSCANVVSSNGASTFNAFYQQPHLWAGQAKEPHGWFYCLPHFRQAFVPASNSIMKEKLPASPYDDLKQAGAPNAVPICAQKRFIVFDQSGDQTTLIFSSGIGAPVQHLASWCPKSSVRNLTGEAQRTQRNPIYNSGLSSINELHRSHIVDTESEVDEDSEELNALLYSDEDYSDSEDDEEVSTGHSPSTMTAHEDQESFEGSTEEVASSDGATKRRKLIGGGYDVPSLIDTASSAEPGRLFDYKNDAESSCANSLNLVQEEMSSLPENKGLRKEKIRETLSILQSMIPCGKDKDAIVVLDEAIHYLKSLKHKARALGLDSL